MPAHCCAGWVACSQHKAPTLHTQSQMQAGRGGALQETALCSTQQAWIQGLLLQQATYVTASDNRSRQLPLTPVVDSTGTQDKTATASAATADVLVKDHICTLWYPNVSKCVLHL